MKKNDRNLFILVTLFVISIVIANVTGARTIITGLSLGSIQLALSGGAITYAVTFLCTDIIGEIWGKDTAKGVVKYGFIGQVFATACIMITGAFPATDPVMDAAYHTLLGQNWIFVIGSLSAYLVSQTWDVLVFHFIRGRYVKRHGYLCDDQFRPGPGLVVHGRGAYAADWHYHRAIPFESWPCSAGHPVFLFLYPER